jgi:hypothetical protein
MTSPFMSETVYRRARSGSDGYGQPTFATAVATKGRWQQKRRMVRDAKGEQVLSEVTVMLDPADTVAPGDQLSRDGTAYLTVITVEDSKCFAQAVLTLAFL